MSSSLQNTGGAMENTWNSAVRDRWRVTGDLPHVCTAWKQSQFQQSQKHLNQWKQHIMPDSFNSFCHIGIPYNKQRNFNVSHSEGMLRLHSCHGKEVVHECLILCNFTWAHIQQVMIEKNNNFLPPPKKLFRKLMDLAPVESVLVLTCG